jgi:succinyl-diaminopimelate desuccinylase
MEELSDPVELTRRLIAFDTSTPPGNEGPCARFIAGLLERAGFEVKAYDFERERTSLVALPPGGSRRAPLCFTGHLDTVPPGQKGWGVDPFAGVIADGKLYGRGASDMKSGIAAMVSAALRLARSRPDAAPLILLTASEEDGARGARYLASNALIPRPVGAILCAEPTSNLPLIGHRGVLWVEATTEGVAAHGSSPELGENAIYKAAEAIQRIREARFDLPPHPVLGNPSLNVGTINGGRLVNEVPDRTCFRIDLRTIPGMPHEAYLRVLGGWLGPDAHMERLLDLPFVLTDPDSDIVRIAFSVMGKMLGRPLEARGARFFTDCSVLTPASGSPPTVILGPGEGRTAHAADEYCPIHRIREAAEAYFQIGMKWIEARPG